MATINYRLQQIASDLFIKYSSDERKYIVDKIDNISLNLKTYFQSSIKEILIFGSFKRDTILPRNFDEESDIDILVVFNYSEYTYTPETYRNQLKRFAESRYSTSKVLKSHPSIVLEMNKIKFDLVPSRITGNYFYTTYQIPDKNGYWQNTDPKGFNEELTRVNTQYNYIVKPLIRVFKRWNSYNDYPYSSYELEQELAKINFSGDNFEKGFLYAVDKLNRFKLPEYQARKVDTLKNNAAWIKTYLDRDNQEKAIEVLCRILGLVY